MQVVSNETPCPASWSSTSQAAAWCSGFRVSHSLPLGPWSQSLLWGRKRERIKKKWLCMRAEGLNLIPLFQIIFCLEVSSEISHYLSFEVSFHHKIHCSPALPALGLTFSFHTVIPTVPDNKTVLPRSWALSETPAPCSQLSLCLTLHGPPHLDTQSHHSTSVLSQAPDSVFTKTNQPFEKGDIFFFIPPEASHSCFMIMTLSGGKSQNINFNLWF